jgi:hypothetical protein
VPRTCRPIEPLYVTRLMTEKESVMDGWVIFGIIILLLIIGLVWVNLRDIIRYLKIRSM